MAKRLTILLVCILKFAFVFSAPEGNRPLRYTNARRSGSSSPLWDTLSYSHECKSDITRLCGKEQKNNFQIINCLEYDDASVESLSPECQHYIWQFKRNMTTSAGFLHATRHFCEKDMKETKACESVPNNGQKIACLFEYKESLKNKQCYSFINRVGVILFSDYHLIYRFAEKCQKSIENLKCGRSTVNQRERPSEESNVKKDLPSTQGRTIACLLEKIDQLDKECTHEIVRVSELQADDYHLDRPLFFACRGDREKLCGKVTSGDGRIFKCLMENAQDASMSEKCREKLTQRMKLREKSFKVDYSFAGSCEKDLKKIKCLPEHVIGELQKDGNLGMSVALSAMVICIENHVKNNEEARVGVECLSEVNDIRRQLMSDFRITPEVVTLCSAPIKEYCSDKIHKKGATIHCLMDRFRGEVGRPGLREYPECVASLKKLIMVADPGSDYRIDPTIVESCGSVIESTCHDAAKRESPGGGAVYGCLMRQLHSATLPVKCAKRLTELQYIMSRDFRLHGGLYQNCKEDAKRICHAPIEWHAFRNTSGGIIFSCLYRQMIKREEESKDESEDIDEDDEESSHPKGALISKKCSAEVLRVLRERAKRIMLNPHIYDVCMSDLVTYCLRSRHKEMRCLEKHYDDLKEKCQEAVRGFETLVDRLPSLDYIMASSCQPMITQFCEKEAATDSSHILPCLIRHKNRADMDSKCRAGVEHHQIISLKDFRISRAFRRACATDHKNFCSSKKTKAEVIICLSEIIRNNTLRDQEVPLTTACRKQVRFENLQKSQDILLSPRLMKACKNDLKQHCSKVASSKKVECLRRQKWSNLQPRCQRALFRRVQLESLDSRIDARLQRVCDQMIKHYCGGHEKDSLDCLWQHIHDEDFDTRCRKVVYLRLETRVKDYRLDPLINHLCKRDIRKLCKDVYNPSANISGNEYRGKVFSCLKRHFREYELSSGCQGHIRQLMIETNMNHHMDPVLRKACEKDVQIQCSKELEDTDGREGDGLVTECLKNALVKNKISSHECKMETLRLVQESRADVHVDVLLYRACEHELRTICRNVPLGNGKQMACLLWAKDDKEASRGMRRSCRKQVQVRADMWEAAAKLAPPETLGELASQISTSNAKNYFFGFLATVVLAIFVFGLCCGRVTKRVHVNAKNK